MQEVAPKGKTPFDTPDAVSTDHELIWFTALAQWMVPYNNKPSPHLVINNIWFPTKEEALAGIAPGFGATIAVRNIERECGLQSKKAEQRVGAFVAVLNSFGVDASLFKDQLDCQFVKNGPYPANMWRTRYFAA